MKTIALYNLKGGVGKTAAAVNLAYLAAQSGVPTLLWDLDPQGGATWYLGIDSGLETRPKRLIKGKAPLGREVRPTRYTALEVLPADLAFRNADVRLDKDTDNRKWLQEQVEPFSETYGLLVLDCPPSFSRLAGNVVQAASTVLTPIIPTPLSLHAWEQIEDHFGTRKYGRDKLVPFFSMVDRRRKLHRQWTEEPPAGIEAPMATWIPYASQIERMGEYRAPVDCFARGTAAAQAYRDLWRELAERASVG